MRVGFVLPHIGPLAGREAIVSVAQHAETLGYDSLWVSDRVLYPLQAGGSVPEAYRYVLDPLMALSLAAAHTCTIGLGTSVLNISYYNPVLLARSLAGLDIVSGGRLKVGLGLGSSNDEFEASEDPMWARGRRADEFVAVLKAVWGPDPVAYSGQFFRVPPCVIGAKPVQKPHPALYLGAYAPGALRRAAQLADGWNAAGVPLQDMSDGMAAMRVMARAAGRDPADMQLVVRANLDLTPEALGRERCVFTGSLNQIAEDVRACEAMGAAEVLFDMTFTALGTSMATLFRSMEELHSLSVLV